MSASGARRGFALYRSVIHVSAFGPRSTVARWLQREPDVQVSASGARRGFALYRSVIHVSAFGPRGAVQYSM